jgi:hypothetical protein
MTALSKDEMYIVAILSDVNANLPIPVPQERRTSTSGRSVHPYSRLGELALLKTITGSS